MNQRHQVADGRQIARWILFGLLMVAMAACSQPDEDGASNVGGEGYGPWDGLPGANAGVRPDYVSANPNGSTVGPDAGYEPRYRPGYGDYDGGYYEDIATADAGASGPDDPEPSREVVRGDIFRLLDDGMILNMNRYRGLQVIDVADPTQPRVIGRLPLSGSPLEMQVVDDRAYVLSNAETSYESSRFGEGTRYGSGSVLTEIDLSNPQKLRLLSEHELEGTVSTSRMVIDGERAALYVATSVWTSTGGYGSEYGYDGGYYADVGPSVSWVVTTISSFDVSAPGAVLVEEVRLEGGTATLQATSEVIMVAHRDYFEYGSLTDISLIDISDSGGHMVEGGTVTVEGEVTSLFNLDFHESMLRVVSTDWSTNHVYTFDASDLDDIVALDEATFGDDEDLYATLFLGNKAFFVTYRRVDPFHAFEITDEGTLIERSEFIVSGWNDFFKPVFGGDRLVGIGVNDEDWDNTVAVSLYDASDLGNSEPLIERVEVESDSSWSEGSWDDRAFSVIQNAVEVEAPDGTVETGMILLPFNGYDYGESGYWAAVQIYTFSRDTLTRRGVMVDGNSQVRRSFVAGDNTTANLSDNKLALYDHENPDEPAVLGEIELAPNYIQLMVFNDFAARVRSSFESAGARGSGGAFKLMELVSLDQNPDLAAPAATVEIPAAAQVHQVGDLAVSITSSYDDAQLAEVSIHDLSDPSHPALAAELAVPAEFSACEGCGTPYLADVLTFDGGLALVAQQSQPEHLYEVEECWTYPTSDTYCWGDSLCTWYEGETVCMRRDGGEPECWGEISECRVYPCGDDWCRTCEHLDDVESAPVTSYCNTYDEYRYWTGYGLQVVDLSSADDPGLSWVELPRMEGAARLTAEGDQVFYSYALPVSLPGDSRAYLAYFANQVDLEDPSSPSVGDPVNIPGVVIAAQGSRLFTHDLVYAADDATATEVTQVTLRDGRAVLDARRRLSARQVNAALLDGRGHLLVSHLPEWTSCEYDADWESCYFERLTILDAETGDLATVGELSIDNNARFLGLRDSVALYGIAGGALVVDLTSPAAAYPSAYHRIPAPYWDSYATTDDTLMVAAGSYGIFSFALDDHNLDE